MCVSLRFNYYVIRYINFIIPFTYIITVPAEVFSFNAQRCSTICNLQLYPRADFTYSFADNSFPLQQRTPFQITPWKVCARWNSIHNPYLYSRYLFLNIHRFFLHPRFHYGKICLSRDIDDSFFPLKLHTKKKQNETSLEGKKRKRFNFCARWSGDVGHRRGGEGALESISARSIGVLDRRGGEQVVQ